MGISLKESKELEQKVRRYQLKSNLFLILQAGLVLLLAVLISWLFWAGYFGVSQTPKALMLYLFPIGIGANIAHLWSKRRKRLAAMLMHESSRLSANPYSYAIPDAQVRQAVQADDAKSHPAVADHVLLGRFVGEVKYPGLRHGGVWMRLLYVGIATFVGCALVHNLVAPQIAGFPVSRAGGFFFVFCAVMIGVANGVRRIRIYQFGIENRSLAGKDLIFFKDIFDVSFDETWRSNGQKTESAQLDLQCIGMDVRFYISDAKQDFYEMLRKMAKMIHQASLHPVYESKKETGAF